MVEEQASTSTHSRAASASLAGWHSQRAQGPGIFPAAPIALGLAAPIVRGLAAPIVLGLAAPIVLGLGFVACTGSPEVVTSDYFNTPVDATADAYGNGAPEASGHAAPLAEAAIADREVVTEDGGAELTEVGPPPETDGAAVISDAAPDVPPQGEIPPQGNDAAADVVAQADSATPDGLDAAPANEAAWDDGPIDQSSPRDSSDDSAPWGDVTTPFDAANVTVPLDSTDEQAPTEADIDDAASCTPGTSSFVQAIPGAARSLGFTGDQTPWDSLALTSCVGGTSDCASACMDAGVSQDSCTLDWLCEAGDEGGSHCVPPPYWFHTDRLRAAEYTESGSAKIYLRTVVGDSDGLIATNFGVQVPGNATITGIEFRVTRAANAPNSVRDSEGGDTGIRLVLPGGIKSDDRSSVEWWSRAFSTVSYGGPGDLWGFAQDSGTLLTPSAVASSDFGISIAARSEKAQGTAQALIDFIELLVYYECR